MKIEQDVSLIQAQILALCDEMQGLEDDKAIAERFEAIGLCEAAMAALEAKAPATAES